MGTERRCNNRRPADGGMQGALWGEWWRHQRSSRCGPLTLTVQAQGGCTQTRGRGGGDMCSETHQTHEHSTTRAHTSFLYSLKYLLVFCSDWGSSQTSDIHLETWNSVISLQYKALCIHFRLKIAGSLLSWANIQRIECNTQYGFKSNICKIFLK